MFKPKLSKPGKVSAPKIAGVSLPRASKPGASHPHLKRHLGGMGKSAFPSTMSKKAFATPDSMSAPDQAFETAMGGGGAPPAGGGGMPPIPDESGGPPQEPGPMPTEG